ASWFAAKMLLEGTQSKTAAQISEQFDALGAFIEVDTGFDEVVFTLFGLKKNFDQVLALFLEVINESIFPEKEFEIMKSTRLDQQSVNDKKNSTYASKMMRKALYGDSHPYGRVLSTDDLKAITLKDVKAFYATRLFHQPVVYVSGQVDPQMIQLIEREILLPSTTKWQESNSIVSSIPELTIERKDSLQSSIKQAWHVPAMEEPAHLDFSIANAFLGGYFGSRLMKNIREDKGYTYGVNSYPIHLKHASFGLISTDVKVENTQDTLNEIAKEIDRLTQVAVPQEEIELVSNYLAGSFLSSINTPFQLMKMYRKANQHGLTFDYYQTYFEALREITSERIMSATHKYFDLSKASTIIVGLKK
ncbi:MAG: insulinase family protein, partial [Reichenbachiella sp.]